MASTLICCPAAGLAPHTGGFLVGMSELGPPEGKGQGPVCLGWVWDALLDAQTTFKAHWPLYDGPRQMGKRKPHGASPQGPLPGPGFGLASPATPTAVKGLIPTSLSMELSNVPK